MQTPGERARLAAAIIDISNDGGVPEISVPAEPSELLAQVEPIVERHFENERQSFHENNICGCRVFSLVCERELDHDGPHWSALHGFFGEH